MTSTTKRYWDNGKQWCRYCDKLFETKIGLGVHKARVHGVINVRRQR